MESYSAGETQYYYDRLGNMTAKVTPEDEVLYEYNAANQLSLVTMQDESSVRYAYDAFGRKVERTETNWVSTGNPFGTPPGLAKEKKSLPLNRGKASEAKEASKGKADLCAEPGEKAGNRGLALGLEKNKDKEKGNQKLKLVEDTTRYLYDGLGLNVLKEYKGLSAPRAEYYYANGQVLGRKLFGLKGDFLSEREPGLANGGTYYYLTDALGSVTELTDSQGQVVKQYRYDAFGGLFTGTSGPYNTPGLTGKSFDPKSGLMDFSARWYDPQVGRFTQADTVMGQLMSPMTQHLFAYSGSTTQDRKKPLEHCRGVPLALPHICLV